MVVEVNALEVGLIPLIVAGFVLFAWITGRIFTKSYVDELKERHKEEVSELKQALALERQRNEIAEHSGAILTELARVLRRELNP